MNIIIKKCDYEEAKKANNLLTKLIIDEKKYDENINEKCVVKSMYEKFYDEENVCLLVGKQNEEIVGYIYGYIENNGDAKIDKVSVLDALYVEEKYRNKNIGKKLINEFKKWSYKNKAKYIELKVCKGNKIAINLYSKMGFVINKMHMSLNLEEENETL